MEPTDESLMKQVAGGDRRALRILYERHAELVFRTAFRFSFDEEEARDITQSVFVTIMQSARSYEPKAKLTTWLYRIVVNRCLNHSSSASSRLRVTSKEQDFLDTVPASDEEQPDRIVDRAAKTERLRAALCRLPERQRVALTLKLYEELSYEEIAEVLGCSKSSVESLLFRARRSLTKEIEN